MSDDVDDDLLGAQFGDYRVLRRIGKGGMGDVYLAEQTSLKRKVALKFLKPALVDDSNYLKRFKDEATAVASLNDTNIVSIYAIGEEAGRHYIVMEYVSGDNLRDLIRKRGGGLDVPFSLGVIKRVASALSAAHAAGIIHRDVKPENVLITSRDVKVADFGLARQMTGQDAHVTQTGSTMGTPLYMSPEQVESKPMSAKTDLYSLGVTAYHMLAGEPPFYGESAIAVALAHLKSKPIPLGDIRPDAPHELIDLIERLMEKSPDKRPASADEVVREVQRIARLSGFDASDSLPDLEKSVSLVRSGVTQTIRTSVQRSVGPIRRVVDSHGEKLAAGGLIALALVVGGGVASSQRERLKDGSPDQTRAAQLRELIPDFNYVPMESSGGPQLQHALLTPPESVEREAALWAVVLRHKGDVDPSLIAAATLFKAYVDSGDYDRAEAVAKTLIDRESWLLKAYGHLMNAIVIIRDERPGDRSALRLADQELDKFFGEFEHEDRFGITGAFAGTHGRRVVDWIADNYYSIEDRIRSESPSNSSNNRVEKFIERMRPIRLPRPNGTRQATPPAEKAVRPSA